MRPPAVGIETNPRSHLAPDSFFSHLALSLSLSMALVQRELGGGKGIRKLSPSHNEACHWGGRRRRENSEGGRLNLLAGFVA